MGKIRGSMKEISTEFQLLPAGSYRLKIDKVTEVPLKADPKEVGGYRVNSKVVGGDLDGKTCSEYIHTYSATDPNHINEFGMAQLKRYFEAVYGKPTVKKWKDEDYDTEKLVGKEFKGQVEVESFQKEGEDQPRLSNKVKAFDKA